MEKIVLASGSPRRKELLARTGVVFSVVVSNGEENTNLTDPAETVEKLSQDKAISVADRLENESEPCLIIGADTVVAFEGKILGKPSDEEDALDTLLKLQGKSHQVYTGVTLLVKEQGIWKPYTFSERTDVEFYPVSREELIQTLLPRTTGRFMRSGLKVKGMRYHAGGYTERYLKGGEAVVAYNPEDVSHVWLLEDGAYQRFDLIESRFCGKNIAEVEKLKADCNEMIKDASAGNLQAKIDLAMHIQNIAGNAVHTGDTKIKNIRKTRQREQRKRHVDFMKEGAGNER